MKKTPDDINIRIENSENFLDISLYWEKIANVVNDIWQLTDYPQVYFKAGMGNESKNDELFASWVYFCKDINALLSILRRTANESLKPQFFNSEDIKCLPEFLDVEQYLRNFVTSADVKKKKSFIQKIDTGTGMRRIFSIDNGRRRLYLLEGNSDKVMKNNLIAVAWRLCPLPSLVGG